jgi:hypothetical protein
MADGSPVIIKDTSVRRRFYSGERIAPVGAMMFDRPPGGHDFRFGTPIEEDIPPGRAVGPFQRSATPHELMENSDSGPQVSGAIFSMGEIYAPFPPVGMWLLAGASTAPIWRVTGANSLSDAWGGQAGIPIYVHDKADDNDYVSAAASEAVLTAYLRARGRGPVADRIEKFLDILTQEPDEAPIAMDSLRSLVSFVLMTPNLRTPIVGADWEGLMELEWHLADNGDPDSYWGRGNGVVSLKFLRSGLIQYVALSGPHQEGVERLRKQGESTKEYMLRSLGEFTPRITRA